MIEFWRDGGFGMYPVAFFGFALVVASVLHALRPRQRWGQIAFVLGIVTMTAGTLGTATGLCATARYLEKVEPIKQVEIFAQGLQESLHNTILAAILVILAALVAVVGVYRGKVATA